MKKLWRGIQSTVSWILTIVLSLIFISVLFQKLGGEVPGVFGYHLMYVLTGSMEPEIMAGDAIIVHEIDGSTVQVGDIVCYFSADERIEGQLVTHEVVVAPYEQDGELYLQTKGVANAEPDEPILAEQVFGRLTLKLLWLGKLYSLFCTVPGLVICVVPIILLMASEVRNLADCIREEKREAVCEAILKEKERKEHEYSE